MPDPRESRGTRPLSTVFVPSSFQRRQPSRRLEEAFTRAQERGQIGAHRNSGGSQNWSSGRGSFPGRPTSSELDEEVIVTDSNRTSGYESEAPKRNSSFWEGSQEEIGPRLESNAPRRASSIYSSGPNEEPYQIVGKEGPETYEEQVKRWRMYFKNGPLMRCLDQGDLDELFSDLLFTRLYKEVLVSASGMQDEEYHGELQARSFWERVRSLLEISDEEIYHDWPLE